MISGSATSEYTASYANRFKTGSHPGHFRKHHDLMFSSIGIGTYLGEMDSETDRASDQAMKEALRSGVNVIDSAINYRGQRSERVIGKVICDLTNEGFDRSGFFISTKGGFIPFDGNCSENSSQYFSQTYIKSGILAAKDVVQGCHAMTPQYLQDQIDRSLKNLQIEAIDLYYLHNPETQLGEISETDFYKRLTSAFQLFEKKVEEGKIKMYGAATWNGFRIPSKTRGYLSLAKFLEAAEEAGGKNHHFRAIQLPYNLGMPEALTTENQDWNGEEISTIEFARRKEIMVFTSASLLQGRLATHIPQKIQNLFPNCESMAACALQFIRSTPGVLTALVGMKSLEHIHENLAVKKIAPLSSDDFAHLFVPRS